MASRKCGSWVIAAFCYRSIYLKTSSNGNIFHVTGHLCGEFTGHRWIPRTKASDAELWWFLWSAADLRRHRAYHDVTVMTYIYTSYVTSIDTESLCQWSNHTVIDKEPGCIYRRNSLLTDKVSRTKYTGVNILQVIFGGCDKRSRRHSLSYTVGNYDIVAMYRKGYRVA